MEPRSSSNGFGRPTRTPVGHDLFFSHGSNIDHDFLLSANQKGGPKHRSTSSADSFQYLVIVAHGAEFRAA